MVTIESVSKGSRFNQIYIPKSANYEFIVGEKVVITPLTKHLKEDISPIFYRIDKLNPIKTEICNRILNSLDFADNVIIFGSFLDKGYNFNDVDIFAVTDKKVDLSSFKKRIQKELEIKPHLIVIDNKSLHKGYKTDPLFRDALSRFVSKKRIMLKKDKDINYKILDVHLLASKDLENNYDHIDGNTKYKLIKNMIAIKLFMEDRPLSDINQEIKKIFGDIEKIKKNMLDKKPFVDKFKKEYNKLEKKILDGAKQAKTD